MSYHSTMNGVIYWYTDNKAISYDYDRPYEVIDDLGEFGRCNAFPSAAESKMYFLTIVEENFGFDFLPV